MEGIARDIWNEPVEDVLRRFGSGQKGLSMDEVDAARKRWGRNLLPPPRRPGIPELFFRQFLSPLIYVLVAAAVVSGYAGDFNDAFFILAIIVINSALGTYHESRALLSMEALKGSFGLTATVIRNGRTMDVEAGDLVPGDLVVLSTGHKVPADLRLVTVEGLQVNESLLTGESLPVEKCTESMSVNAPLPADRLNMAFAATTVVHGRGTGVVTSIGTGTEIGKIAGSMAGSMAGKPPLILRMESFSRKVSVIVVGVCLALGIAGWWQGMTVEQVFFLMVAAGVSAIPEGLPIALTVALATGARRMTERKVIVRQLPAVEGLGSCTLIASDKTGTLTQDRPAVSIILLPSGREVEVSGPGDSGEGMLHIDGLAVDVDSTPGLHEFIRATQLCNESTLESFEEGWRSTGDTVDIALKTLAHKSGRGPEQFLAGAVLVRHHPYEPENRFSAAYTSQEGEEEIIMKGAVEAIARYMRPESARAAREAAEDLAARGLRVIAIASGKVEHVKGFMTGQLNWVGLAGLGDPLRPGVTEAVRECHAAGLRVVMVTGDHPVTALVIARELGIAEREEQVVSGAQWQQAMELGQRDRIDAMVREGNVFARVTPLQKKELVEGFQRMGHYVAVTGDGANDAPALRASNIGVAMGSGSDLARECASIVITDDHFASIVAGVEEGRFTYDNLRNILHMLLSTGLAELVSVAFAILAGLPMPFLAVQLLWLNLVTNGIQEIGLGFEKGDPGSMRRGPRSPGESFFDRQMNLQILVSGLTISLIVCGVWTYLVRHQGSSMDHARSMIMLLMVMLQNLHVLNCRSERRSLFRIPIRNNLVLVVSVVVAQLVHVSASHVPWLGSLLHLEPIAWREWAVLLPLALMIILVMELFKRVVARHAIP